MSLQPAMAGRNAPGKIGLLFGAATLIVMMAGAAVVGAHLTGRLHIDDGLAAVALPLSAR
jgi:hypothetical protein